MRQHNDGWECQNCGEWPLAVCVVCLGSVNDCPAEDRADAICRDCGFDRMEALSIAGRP